MTDFVQNGARRNEKYALVIRGGATDEDYVEGGFLRGATEDGQLGPIVVVGEEGAELATKKELEELKEELTSE